MYLCVVVDALLVVLTINYYCLMCRAIGKVVDRYSGTIVGVVMFGTNGQRWCCCGRQWWRKRGSCLCVMGGVGRWWRWKSNICGRFKEVYYAEIGNRDGGSKNGV